MSHPVPVGSPCTIEGCDGRVKARGYCNSHYITWQNYGDPTAAQYALTTEMVAILHNNGYFPVKRGEGRAKYLCETAVTA